MSTEDAYSILEAIAEIHGRADKLKLIAMDEAQKQAEEMAQEIDAEHKERLLRSAFPCAISSPVRRSSIVIIPRSSARSSMISRWSIRSRSIPSLL